MYRLVLGVANEYGYRREVTKGEVIEGELFTGYSELYQMNTYLVVSEFEIAIGIDGNRQDEQIRWETFPKGGNWDIEPFYNDDFLVEYII